MKNVLLVLMILFSAASDAQTSKVVFYRNDTWDILPFHNQGLFFNKKRIHRIRNHEVYVYSSNNTNGNYYMMPNVKRTVTVNNDPGEITFVEVKLRSEAILKKSAIQKKSLAQFREDYEKKKWLRKNMAKAGYKSVDDLVGHDKVAFK